MNLWIRNELALTTQKVPKHCFCGVGDGRWGKRTLAEASILSAILKFILKRFVVVTDSGRTREFMAGFNLAMSGLL